MPHRPKFPAYSTDSNPEPYAYGAEVTLTMLRLKEGRGKQTQRRRERDFKYQWLHNSHTRSPKEESGCNVKLTLRNLFKRKTPDEGCGNVCFDSLGFTAKQRCGENDVAEKYCRVSIVYADFCSLRIQSSLWGNILWVGITRRRVITRLT
jgi:hypothetical protein